MMNAEINLLEETRNNKRELSSGRTYARRRKRINQVEETIKGSSLQSKHGKERMKFVSRIIHTFTVV